MKTASINYKGSLQKGYGPPHNWRSDIMLSPVAIASDQRGPVFLKSPPPRVHKRGCQWDYRGLPLKLRTPRFNAKKKAQRKFRLVVTAGKAITTGKLQCYFGKSVAADLAGFSKLHESCHFPITTDEREILITEYHDLVDRELRRPLNSAEKNRLAVVEARLDAIDSQDPHVVETIQTYRRDAEKLRELNAIAERLKAFV
jgi:hypothetical protein